jgi:RHS repeat-associated protein
MLKFFGGEQVKESRPDYFGARYYNHKHYRFLSVEPVINRDEALSNPQLWNLYSFCRNNPVSFLDPDGRVEILPQLTIHYVKSQEIAAKTGGMTRGGYFDPTKFKTESKLEKMDGSWSPRVTIHLKMDIYVPQEGDPVYEFKGAMGLPKNQQEALEHEMGHALIGLIQVSEVYRDATILESIRTRSKLLTKAAITAFQAHNLSYEFQYLVNQKAYDFLGFTLFPILKF